MYDLKTRFFSAMRRRLESASPSEHGSPSSSGDLRRIAGGMTASISAARESNPSARSIATWSAGSGPMWRRWKAPWSSSCARVSRARFRMGVSGMAFPRSALGGGGFLVRGGIEQLVDVAGIGGVYAEHPRGGRDLVHFFPSPPEIPVLAHQFSRNPRLTSATG